MRSLGLTLTALLLTSPIVLGQAPGTPASKDAAVPAPAARPLSEKNQKYLDAYLKAWEERMSTISGLETKVILTETADGQKTAFTGDAALMKPNFAKLFLKQQENPSNHRRWRHYVADGRFLWDYDYQGKVARVLQLPKEGIGDNTMMTMLFGMKSADVKKRFDLSIDVDDNTRFNANYIHFTILPRTREDMQEFKKAELVLWKNDADKKYVDHFLLPARLWFQQPNGNQITWEFRNMTIKTTFPKDEFKAPGFPDKEWRSEWVKPPTPTVSRTSAPAK
jgi:TIGR03009 family protein